MYFLRKTSAGHAHCKSREPPHRQIATLGRCKVLHASGLLGGARGGSRFATKTMVLSGRRWCRGWNPLAGGW